MDNEKIKDDKLRKKAEKVLQNQFYPIKNQTKNLPQNNTTHIGERIG